MKAAEDADLIIYVVDGSRALDENDKGDHGVYQGAQSHCPVK